MNLTCALCFYTSSDEDDNAITVLNGNAVCVEHAHAVLMYGNFTDAVRAVKRDNEKDGTTEPWQ